MFWFGRERRERAIADALAASVDAVRSGAITPEEALARFPDQAAELEPLLRTSARLAVIGRAEPAADARARARRALMLAAARGPMTAAAPITTGRRRPWLAFAPAATAALIFALLAVPVMGSIDSGSVPGDWNYGFKRATERVRLALTVDTNDRRMLRLEFANRRLDEIERLSSKGVQTQAPTVKALIVDYNSDVQQVQSSIASSSAAVPSSTAEQLDSIDSRAQQVLTPLTEGASTAAPTVAQDAQDAVVTTHSAAATAQEHRAGRNQHEATPTQVVAAAAPPTAQPPPAAPTAAPPPPTLAPTPPPTATPSPIPTPTPVPTVTPTPAPTETLGPAVVPTVVTPAPVPTRAAEVLGGAPVITATVSTPLPATRSGAIVPLATQTPAPSATSPATAAVTPVTGPPTSVATRSTSLLPVSTPAATPAPLVQNLVAGDNAFTYSGAVPTTIDAVIASVAPNVVYVAYPNPAGVGVLEWFPGGVPVVIAPGTHLVLHMKAAATLVLPR